MKRSRFNNDTQLLLIKESISNFQRILHLLIQNKFELKTITTKINVELDDIAVIQTISNLILKDLMTWRII
jgi:hypothetical protein